MQNRGIIAAAASLLLRVGRNVLLSGPPGTGKTLLASGLSELFTSDEPVVAAGSGDMSSNDLLYKSVPGGSTGWDIELGALSVSVLASWARIVNGLTPRWLLLDELNRMNAEVVLGPLFTAFDITSRLSSPVVPMWLVRRVLQSESLLYDVAIAARLDPGETRKSLEIVADKTRGAGLTGFPLPLSWRNIATVNTVDRSHLFRLGFALLRRYPPLMVLGPLARLEQRFNPPGSDPSEQLWSYACRQAAEELTIRNSLVLEPLLFITDPVAASKEIFRSMKSIFAAVEEIIRIMEDVGVGTGWSHLVDTCKLALAVYIEGGVSEKEALVADTALAAVVLPALGSIAPIIKTELLLQGRSPRREAAEKIIEKAEQLVGEQSLTGLYAEALRLELGIPPRLRDTSKGELVAH